MNQEPVNIKGVVAFPNPDKDKRVIRFIDSCYHTLFTVPDGGNIVLITFDGGRSVLPCTYIDDYHAEIGVSVYHICQFAEFAERRGAVYAPEHPKEGDICDTYEIYQIQNVGKVNYCFRSFEIAKGQFQASDYRKAYAGVLAPGVTMEEIYAKHNQDTRPFWGKMRSMSVSDVLVINRGGKRTTYYVDSVGFQEVKQFFRQRAPKKKGRGEAR